MLFSGEEKQGEREEALSGWCFFYFGKKSHSLVTKQQRFMQLCSARSCSALASHKSWCSSERFLVCLNGSWLESGTYVVRYPSFSTAPKRRYVPVSHGQHSDGSAASVCLVHGRPLILVLPGNPVQFSIRFCCQLMQFLSWLWYL